MSSVGCMKILVVTVVPAGKGFPTSHCSVRLLDGVGGEHRTETWEKVNVALTKKSIFKER